MTPTEERRHHRRAARIAGLRIAEFVPAASHHLVLRGMRLHHLDWGTPGCPPVVFLHGGGQTARTWDLVCLALRPDYHCLALDQRGHGDSEWSSTGEYGFAAHVGDLEAFVDRLGLERFVLVGMSMGCINGLFYAVRHPRRVAAFVAVDAAPCVRRGGGERIVAFRRRTRELPSLEAYVEHALRFNPRRDRRLLRQSLLHNLRRLPSGRWTWKTDQRRLPPIAELMGELETLWPRLGRIRCPSLVVRGAESDVLLDADAERFATALPRGRWVRIPGAGHTVQGDNPGALVTALRQFLAEARIGRAA